MPRRSLGAALALGLFAFSAMFGSASVSAHEAWAPPETQARPGLVGLDLNLQIETVSPAGAAGVPNQGVIVKRYLPRGQWTSQGAGGAGHRVASGTYQLGFRGANILEDRSIEVGGQLHSTTRYTFESAKSGTWVQTLSSGQQVLSGHFTSAPSQPSAEQMLAPSTNAGLHVALIIKSALAPQLPPGVYPTAGLVLQTYALDGTMNLQGFGPGNLNSKGTFSYKRLSANTAVEEAIQTSDFFSWPYTMVYTFKTPNSGTWYQSLNNGLIQFSGTFDTFPR
ncbi:hypothetical protein [Roseateles oligotrophus]|uniref:Uncharacterized protein n=1 Tax=Roseateles oligotrophus TaxID=1769250 RepID=A0ABT2YDK2_9BURK|nr:hypothetical protein [Roseateles oligotrophus]MCV2368111.1 hypothetical protein [Roseateles oligotrophus]